MGKYSKATRTHNDVAQQTSQIWREIYDGLYSTHRIIRGLRGRLGPDLQKEKIRRKSRKTKTVQGEKENGEKEEENQMKKAALNVRAAIVSVVHFKAVIRQFG